MTAADRLRRLYGVVVEYFSLFATCENLDVDTSFLSYLLQYLLPVAGIPHGSGGAGAVLAHVV